jgi:hypothetical protein
MNRAASHGAPMPLAFFCGFRQAVHFSIASRYVRGVLAASPPCKFAVAFRRHMP